MARAARKHSQTFSGTVSWNIGGRYIKLLATVSAVDLQLYLRGQLMLDAQDVEGGFYQGVEFDRVDIATSAAELVEFLVADAEGGSDRLTGDFTMDNLYAATLTNEATASVGVAAALALAAAAGRKWLRFRSRSTNVDDICLGAAGVTMNGPLRISPGEVVDVTTAAPAAWYAIAGTAAQNLDILSGT